MTAITGSPAPRVGFLGHLGAQNIGNDASLEAVLAYLRSAHPDVICDAMCPGPARVRAQYGIDAIPLFWQQRFDQRVQGLASIPLKALGKGIDAMRTAAWVRRHDVVIVPGAGVLEASLPLWPWAMPYALFLLSASGRLFGTKVAFVGVGAGAISKPMTRWLSNTAARLAYYRSYRDPGAREAIRQRGVDVSRDHVYTDLAFALPEPIAASKHDHTGIVGVGVMAYAGSNDERAQAQTISARYVSVMKSFVRWLVDNDRQVRLFVGDTNGSDESVVQEILADLRESRPDLPSAQVVAQQAISFTDVMAAMQQVDSVVAIRYHNIVCAVKLSKPTISISYSPKHDVLMADMGLAAFCQPVTALSATRLVEQLAELEKRSPELQATMRQRNAVKRQLLDEQFAELSAVLLPTVRRVSPSAVREAAL